MACDSAEKKPRNVIRAAVEQIRGGTQMVRLSFIHRFPEISLLGRRYLGPRAVEFRAYDMDAFKRVRFPKAFYKSVLQSCAESVVKTVTSRLESVEGWRTRSVA